jgi:mannose-6-phosphate isomerase-like protein (cupin superfamily)
VREDRAKREIVIHPGEFIIIPHGVEHCPSADEETHIMLLEPKSTLTGNTEGERTVRELEKDFRRVHCAKSATSDYQQKPPKLIVDWQASVSPTVALLCRL